MKIFGDKKVFCTVRLLNNGWYNNLFEKQQQGQQQQQQPFNTFHSVSLI